jgi:hypothetical protein
MADEHRPDRLDPRLAGILDLESVPPVTTTRWWPRHKAQVVAAVEAGLLSPEEACDLYRLSPEELSGWMRNHQLFGERGLRATRQRRRFGTVAFDSWAGSRVKGHA